MELEQLQKHHDALLNENNALKDLLGNERAEKQAIDAMFCEQIKQMVGARKHIVILENSLKGLHVEKAQLQDQVARLEEKVKSLEVPLTQAPQEPQE